MKIFDSIGQVNAIKNPVLTLGMFDGLHLGHQKIIQQLNAIAKNVEGESTLLTFEPHPRLVLQQGFNDLQLLTTLDEKISLLDKFGLDNLIIHPFTKEFSQLSSVEFVKQLLVDEIGIHTLVIGYDHHFGKNREGNFEQLKELSEEFGFELVKIEEVQSDGLHISSTQIRKALREGNVEFASGALGRNYSISGEVIHGDGIGRTLGFPTANMKLEKYKLIPENGVYMAKVQLHNKTYKGLLSIGTRPTVNDLGERRVEVFILDFDQSIYGELVTVAIITKIRDDKKFASLDELVQQMKRDKEFAERFT